MLQQTIKKNLLFEGIGYHSGEKCVMELLPAPTNTGILFNVKDEYFSYVPQNVVSTQKNLAIGNENIKIKSVENLMSACFGLNIFNLIVRIVEGSELPIFDGSAFYYIERLKNEIQTQDTTLRSWSLLEPISLQLGEDRKISLLPSQKLEIQYSIDFSGTVIGKQQESFVFNSNDYISKIAKARIFGFIEEVYFYNEYEIAKGANRENTLIASLSEKKYLNEPIMKNEEVKHKILNMLAFFPMFNADIKMKVVCEKGGHLLDFSIIQYLFQKALIQ